MAADAGAGADAAAAAAAAGRLRPGGAGGLKLEGQPYSSRCLNK